MLVGTLNRYIVVHINGKGNGEKTLKFNQFSDMEGSGISRFNDELFALFYWISFPLIAR